MRTITAGPSVRSAGPKVPRRAVRSGQAAGGSRTGTRERQIAGRSRSAGAVSHLRLVPAEADAKTVSGQVPRQAPAATPGRERTSRHGAVRERHQTVLEPGRGIEPGRRVEPGHPEKPGRRAKPGRAGEPGRRPEPGRRVDRGRRERVEVAGDVARPRQGGLPGRPARPTVRLTRRGRTLVAILAAVALLLVVALAWLAGTARAQASLHGAPPGAVYRNLTEVVVQPGQSLWSIASTARPTGDPRTVVQEIITLNDLRSVVIEPGQRLWVPKHE
jgi:LysM domain